MNTPCISEKKKFTDAGKQRMLREYCLYQRLTLYIVRWDATVVLYYNVLRLMNCFMNSDCFLCDKFNVKRKKKNVAVGHMVEEMAKY